VIGFGLTAIS